MMRGMFGERDREREEREGQRGERGERNRETLVRRSMNLHGQKCVQEFFHWGQIPFL